ncbi:hypothetical protein M3223_02505 [Paenibacillus pasadenensis]|uniref:hypothetical protein n=1 Tax=Paenibacillus pasadenensis TaxID=217090 RepID=UPI00203B52B0|nr:hypothetical protein [Paenibacillus pasadenensis]MCM3746221.1 hypothetical protein [Paenibacillus pasadenensis]
MAKKTDVMSIHGIQGSSIGFVLVLFILLVIVTSMFSLNPYSYPDEDDSSGIQTVQSFRVFNQTTAYKLNVVSHTNIQNPGTTVRSGESQALVLVSSPGFIYYSVLNNSNSAYVGALSVNLSSTAGFSINSYSGPIAPVVLREDPYRLVVRYSIP